ncbi:phosphatase PAP2 family protein [Mycobacterium vicinigordonae]|uniref:phosphatase PAP2 family protein n=1 Tax=Mycobacterium vicinigordonae TaxID=1719132 RepID=UPI003CCC9A49
MRSPAAWLAVVAVVLYTLLWVAHRQHWGWLHTVDWALLNPAHDIGTKHAGWVRFWFVVSFVLGPVPLRLFGLVVAAFALARRQLRLALLVLTCAVLSGLVTWAAKGLAGRPRPSTALVVASETSFPSGHALETMSGVLALLTCLLPLLATRRLRMSAVAAGALSVFTVGVARVALNVHHPSDVVAGWALGYAFFILCMCVLRPSPSRRRDPIGP